MKFALDAEGKRIHISKTHAKNEYFCEECGEKLVLKKGEINAHHFAHPKNSVCTDSWSYDMSEWHQSWQAKFPIKNQEVVMTHNGIKHRADVFINDTVIEFQHSPLSSLEFEERNRFYTSLGYKVVWVFDVIDLWDARRIEETDKDNIYKWTHPKNTFDMYNYKDKNIEIYFQISSEEYGDTTTLMKVTWIAPTGFERFAIEDNYYDEEDFLYRYLPKKLTKEDLYDVLICHYTKDHATYFYGCPLSKTHYAVNHHFSIPESEYDNYRPCTLCEYSDFSKEGCVCRQRVSKIKLPEQCEILAINRTYGGQIYSIKINESGIEREIKVFPLIERLEDTIVNVWDKIKPTKVAIIRNLKNNVHVKIFSNQIEAINKYKKCFGYISKDGTNYSIKSLEVFDYDKKQWVWVWYR